MANVPSPKTGGAKTAGFPGQKPLLAGVILFPLILAAAMAWGDWKTLERQIAARLTQRVDLLHENAQRFFQMNKLLLREIDDRVAGMDWPEIAQRRTELTAVLERICSQVEEVDRVALVDDAGVLQALAGRSVPPGPPTNVTFAGRTMFERLKNGTAFVIDGPYRSPVTDEQIFNIGRRLTNPNGSFRGAAVLTISPERLAAFWHDIIEPGDSVTYVLDDGTVLVRVPAVPATGVPARVSDLALAKLRAAERGQFEQPRAVFDNIARTVAFRKLTGYPLYIAYGIDRRNILREWLPTAIGFAALALATAFVLYLVARAVVRRAEELRASEARYRALWDKAPAIMHALDMEGNILAVSDRWLEFMGYTRPEVIGRNIGEFRTVASATEFRNRNWKLAITLGGVTNLERQFLRKGGEPADVLITSRPEVDGNGNFLRMMVVLEDVTEKKRIENALRQAQKMEAVGQLTGGIAHDFNNLLQVVLGGLDSALLRLGDMNPEARRFIEMAVRGAQRGAMLTQRLLAFSRQQPLTPKPIDPNRLVSGMSDMLRRTLGEQVEIETVLAGGLWKVSADPNQLESALLNLAVNARDAMPGGGKLTIETANVSLDEGYAAVNDDVAPGLYVMIAISDTGQGMTQEVIGKAFDPFFTTKGVGEGTGLGLSQVYGFMKQSGGHVKIYSEPGQGTTIRLYLPQLVDSKNPQPTQLAPAAHSGHGTILLVEDDSDVRAHTAELLGELGYRVLAAADGREAMEILDREREVALLFTDVGLPGELNGRQVAEEAQRRRPGIRTLFTTGYARNAIVHHGRLDPGVELIVKPFTRGELATRIRKILEADGATPQAAK